MKKQASVFLFLAILMCPKLLQSQAVLNADGPGNTYELINSIFAPGYTAVEAPDQCGNHAAFGRHIAEVWDADLNQYVFEFYSHVASDNDRCINFDRQRVEIKTYESSPANLKGTTGETVTYKWRFKVPVGFQPSGSFTHIHQVKAVGGDDDDPIFTLTARKGTPHKLELIYVPTSTSSSNKVSIVNLSLFEGVWVEAKEVVKLGLHGTYSMVIKKVSDGSTIINYSNNDIATIRPDNDFIRPKWGIYRSLNSPADLRDESIRLNSFSITEGVISGQAYYWNGGATIKSFTDDNNWNTQLDGSGISRLAAGAKTNDILIFDGSNIGGSTPATGTVTATIPAAAISLGQLKFQNNATVFLQGTGGGTASVTLNGDGTASPGFEVAAGSVLTINSPLSNGNINIALSAGVGGWVGGSVTLSNTGTHRITSQMQGGLVFDTGAIFNSDGMPASSAYPFGNSSQAIHMGVVFQSGSSLVVRGNRSPMGSTSTFQACNMLPGSNFFLQSNASSANGSWANLKTYGNIIVDTGTGGTPTIFAADGPFYKIENVTIREGCTFITHSSGHTPILGNLVVDGMLSAPAGSTNTLVLGGNTLQSISGNGTIHVPSLSVPNYSDVLLSKSIDVATATNIYGKMNFGNNSQLTGTGTFTSRVAGTAASITGTTIKDSFTVKVSAGSPTGTGLFINGPGLAANTNVVGFSTSNTVINLSIPASASGTGTYTFGSDSATLVTANPNGMDPVNGSVVASGNRTFQSGTNYIINGATGWPFGINTAAPSAMILGRVIINDFVTTNYNVKIRGGLYINAGNLTVRSVDTVNVISMNGGTQPAMAVVLTSHANKIQTGENISPYCCGGISIFVHPICFKSFYFSD